MFANSMATGRIYGRDTRGKICKRLGRIDVNATNCRKGDKRSGIKTPSKQQAFKEVEKYLRRGCKVAIKMVE